MKKFFTSIKSKVASFIRRFKANNLGKLEQQAVEKGKRIAQRHVDRLVEDARKKARLEGWNDALKAVEKMAEKYEKNEK